MCIFCDNNTFGRRVRSFSAGYGAKKIRDLIREILGIPRREGIAFPWICMVRVDNLDRGTLELTIDTRETIHETIRFALAPPLSDVVVTINTRGSSRRSAEGRG